jgi:hypothetical protein
VTNGSESARSALVYGVSGGVYLQDSGAVTNFATIKSAGVASYGVNLGSGSVTNGAANDTTALIEGYGGVRVSGAGSVVNFGAIEAVGLADINANGVFLETGASLTNGSSKDTSALIEGYNGVLAQGAATVTNFGTIAGTDGAAVWLDPDVTLAVEAGSAFEGAVFGFGATLDLASGTGTISGLSSAGDVTVSGSMATTTFDEFGTLEIGAGASFSLIGTDTLTAGQSLIDDGTLTVTGALTSAGTLGGTGTVDFTAGTDALTGGTLSVADLNVNGATVTL